MNQTFGVVLALCFLMGVGIFNLSLGISNVRKRNRSHFIGWLRMALGLFLFIVATWFIDKLRHGFFE